MKENILVRSRGIQDNWLASRRGKKKKFVWRREMEGNMVG